MSSILMRSMLSKRASCPGEEEEDAKIEEDPIWHSLTVHHLGLIIAATFGLIAIVLAFFLILRHATHYLKPHEQKHIIRILFMIPIYAMVSFLSYLYYRHAVYFEVIRDCYEAFAIASFLNLMVNYVAPTMHEQKEYFRHVTPKNWVWPLNWIQWCFPGHNGEYKGWMRKPRSGLTWFNIVWVSVFQYCFIRVFCTTIAVITQATGVYCSSSLNPKYAYVWTATLEATSVTVAMYNIIQFYVQMKVDLAEHKPFLKVLCIKLVIFFCFWQSLLISFLASDNGPLKPGKKVASADLRIGIPASLVCFEMAIFAVMHMYAFPWKPYDLKRGAALSLDDNAETPKRYVYGPARALASAFNPWDFVKAFARGIRWLFVGRRRRHEDISYKYATKLETISPETAYAGPTFAGNGESAVGFTGSRTDSANAGQKGSEDKIGLLSDSQANPTSQGPSSYHSHGYQPYSEDPDRLPPATLAGQEYGVEGAQHGGRTEYEMPDTSYHGTGSSLENGHERYYQRPAPSQGQNPTDGPQSGNPTSNQWNMFGGVQLDSRPPGGGPPGTR